METVVGDSNLAIPQTEDSGGVPRIVKHKPGNRPGRSPR